MKKLYKNLITEILENTYLMSLATIDDGGLWVSDLVYVDDDDFNIYWLSQPDIRHSKAIINNKSVAASITLNNNQGEDNFGLQISGEAIEVDGNIIEIAKKHLIKRKKGSEYKPEDILDGNKFWYKLTPNVIDIIYEPLWGFKKHKVELYK